MRFGILLLLLAQVAVAGERVVAVRDPAAVKNFDVQADRVRVMVAKGICALTGKDTEAAAWATLVTSNDVVGIKVATSAAPLHATHPPVVAAIVAGLQAAGVATTNIIVWDRDPDKLRAAGYDHARAIIPGGWDDERFYESGIVGKLIWSDLMFGKQEEGFGARSYLPQLVTRTITKLINVPVLQDNDACGIAGCLYNTSIGLVDNNRRFEFPGQHGEPDITLINMFPDIKDKLILHVMDALIGGYAGGATFKPQYSWSPGLVLFSRDPVALDTYALELLEAQRKAASIPPIDARAIHLNTAARYRLGGPERELVELTVP